MDRQTDRQTLKRRKNIEVRKLNKKMLEIFQNMLMLLLGKQFENVENSLSIHLKTEKIVF